MFFSLRNGVDIYVGRNVVNHSSWRLQTYTTDRENTVELFLGRYCCIISSLRQGDSDELKIKNSTINDGGTDGAIPTGGRPSDAHPDSGGFSADRIA